MAVAGEDKCCTLYSAFLVKIRTGLELNETLLGLQFCTCFLLLYLESFMNSPITYIPLDPQFADSVL